MNKKSKIKSVLVGDEKLINRNDWVPLSEMDTDMKVLTHKIFDDAFKKIVISHEPKHNVAFISLCTASRPYYLSQKWKKFISVFGDEADLIVASSGGLIPREYWLSYPYLTYDSDFDKNVRELYVEKMEKRLLEFFKTHHYDYVVANFRPNLRGTVAVRRAMAQLKEQDKVGDYIIIPNEEEYQDVANRGYPYGKCSPDLDPLVLGKIHEKISENIKTKQNILDAFFV